MASSCSFLSGSAVLTAPSVLHRRAQPFSDASRTLRVVASATQKDSGRREVLLKSLNVGVLASLFTFGAVDRPSDLGVQDYTAQGGGRTLGLCPKSPNCISTAGLDDEVRNNPEEGKRKTPATQAEAMEELVSTVLSLKPDKFEPTLIERTDDYAYFEFQSPTFGFIDDVEFLFQKDGTVEYRSASRIGESDGDINRKRIRDIRKALQKFGWKSIGY